MKYIILILIILSFSPLFGQKATHHEDKFGRRWVIHTYNNDSTICYIYGPPKRYDRPLIRMVMNGDAYNALYYIKARRRGRKPKVWSFLET